MNVLEYQNGSKLAEGCYLTYSTIWIKKIGVRKSLKFLILRPFSPFMNLKNDDFFVTKKVEIGNTKRVVPDCKTVKYFGFKRNQLLHVCQTKLKLNCTENLYINECLNKNFCFFFRKNLTKKESHFFIL